MQQDNIINVKIDLIIPGKYQPRKNFSDESLNELAKSVKEYGILNPILVTKNGDLYEIIAGERRYRAAKKVGLTEVPVIVKELTESKKAEIALIENLQRENLTPIEEAKSYQEIMKIGNLTQQSLGEKIGKSQSAIANKIRLLTLPKNIQDALSNKQISERHARSLMTVNDEEEQNKLLDKVIKNKMTVKELDNLINQERITEKEIKDAINDIMKSLNLETEEEEESDNMNNGNFFPNFNNTMGTNNNVSLNSMNMQSMENNVVPQMPETVMPTDPIQNQMVEPMMTQPMHDMQQTVPPIQEQKQPVLENNLSFDQPLFNPQVTIPVTPLEPQIMPEQMITPMPQMQDTPLFGGDFNTQVTPTIEPIIEQPALPQESLLEVPNINNVVDQNINLYANPVENQPTNTYYEDSQVIQPEVVAPSFEIPVTTEPTADKLTEVKTLLDQNGINYKLYSNETNHCLIIEIEKFS